MTSRIETTDYDQIRAKQNSGIFTRSYDSHTAVIGTGRTIRITKIRYS